MINYSMVDFKGRIPGGASINFLSAEIPVEFRSPFILVRYSVHEKMQEQGLCLDIDKRVFLDHFEDDEKKEEILKKAAPEIVKFLGDVTHLP